MQCLMALHCCVPLRYRVTPKNLADALLSDPVVNAYAIFVAEEDTANQVRARLTPCTPPLFCGVCRTRVRGLELTCVWCCTLLFLQMAELMPAGRGHFCEDTANLPRILRQIFANSLARANM